VAPARETEGRDELLRRAYELRRTKPGSAEEGAVLRELGNDPELRWLLRHEARARGVEPDTCNLEHVILLAIHGS